MFLPVLFARVADRHRADREHSETARAPAGDAGVRGREHLGSGDGRALRRGRPRHGRPLRGDRLPRDHRRRAAQAELRHLSDRGPAGARARRRDHPLCRRPHPAAAGADGGTVPLRDTRCHLSRQGPPVRLAAAEAGRHLCLRVEPPVPAGRHRRVSAGRVHRRSARSGGESASATKSGR
jgi:hypothetical protein